MNGAGNDSRPRAVLGLCWTPLGRSSNICYNLYYIFLCFHNGTEHGMIVDCNHSHGNTRTSIPHNAVFQLRICLEGIEPPIWRRVRLSGNASLKIVHMVIQVSMGWTNSHLHQFIVPEGKLFSDPSFELNDAFDRAVDNEARVEVRNQFLQNHAVQKLISACLKIVRPLFKTS